MADEGGEGGEVVDIPDRLIVWDVMRPEPSPEPRPGSQEGAAAHIVWREAADVPDQALEADPEEGILAPAVQAPIDIV